MTILPSLKEIAIIENNPIYTITIVYILHNLEYSWVGSKYFDETRDLWYPKNVFQSYPPHFTEYIKILVDPVHKYFYYISEICTSAHKNTFYKELLKLL